MGIRLSLISTLFIIVVIKPLFRQIKSQRSKSLNGKELKFEMDIPSAMDYILLKEESSKKQIIEEH